MKRNFVLAFAMMISTVILAQHHHPGPGRQRESQSDIMKSELSLSANQYASIKSIEKKYSDKRSALHADSTQSKDARHTAMKEMRAAREAEINAVLTPDQKTKWEAYKTKRNDEHKAKAKEHDVKRGEQLKKDLSLSDDQSTKMNAADKTFHEKLQTLMKENKSDKKAEVAKIKSEHDAAVKGILSDEQYKKWTEMKAEHKGKHDHKGKRGGGKKN